MPAIERIRIEGFKSIRDADVKLNNLNVLVGANGSGKSNFIGAFRFLRELVEENLRIAVALGGGPDSYLHFGRARTSALRFHLQFAEQNGKAYYYSCWLAPTQNHDFVFINEEGGFGDPNRTPDPGRNGNAAASVEMEKAGFESRIMQLAEQSGMAQAVREAMSSWRVYHFHDTSDSAKVKLLSDLHDNRYLRGDAGNLAAFLYFLQEQHPGHFRRIVNTIRLAAPFFGKFRLRPNPLNPDKISLEWQERTLDSYFNASALSDGTLRFMALVTLLQQPVELMPATILVDEPELGLHPAAITLLAEMLQAAAQVRQVIVSTQSVTLVNQLTPEDLLIVEREDNASVFKRLDAKHLANWMEGYSLGELWEKNLIGSRPGA